MTTTLIMEELSKLPVTDRLMIIEKTLQAIENEREANLGKAVDALYNDYKADKELTIFTQLDLEPFYEAR